MHVEPSTQVGYQTGEQAEEGSSTTELIRSMALSSAELWHDILLRLDEVQRNQAMLAQAVAQLGSMVENWMLTGAAPSLAAPPGPAELPPFEPPASTHPELAQAVELDASEAALEPDEVELEDAASPPAKPKRRRFLHHREHARQSDEPEATALSPTEPKRGRRRREHRDQAPEPEATALPPTEPKRGRRRRKHRDHTPEPEATLESQDEALPLFVSLPPPPLPVFPASPPPPAAFAAEPEPVTAAQPEPAVAAWSEPVAVVEPDLVFVESPEPVAVIEPDLVFVVPPEPEVVAVVEVEPEIVLTDVETGASQQAATGEALSFLAESLSTLAAPDSLTPRAPAPLVYTPVNAETALVIDPPLPPAPLTLDPVPATSETVDLETAAPVPAVTEARPVEDIHTSASLASEILGSTLPLPAADLPEPLPPAPLVISEDLTLRSKHKKRLQFHLH